MLMSRENLQSRVTDYTSARALGLLAPSPSPRALRLTLGPGTLRKPPDGWPGVPQSTAMAS